ncbi:hypothetical protein SEA_IAMGROOT_43 [Microbacterium phage IAmGroot]|uniref:Uncharacterized protein n=1 Tax=Microbacterium phage IAmGroot TaxID=2588486 RepID=A0A4Y6E8P2_9CAUD|nr:hypothetical protein SEA_IAMGROOT_43 [Microbacterium phage IAmGroot]
MTPCLSRYTIDRRTGEALECDKPADAHDRHTATYGGHGWYWHSHEEDPRG